MRLNGLGDALPSNILQTIASTIQQVEGYYPGSLAYINNNPGNLVLAGQSGAVAGQGQAAPGLPFAKFPSYQAGLNALYSQIQNYADRGMTIAQMMQVYAPGDDPVNNPTSYAATIAAALGVTPDTLLTSIQYGMGTPDLSGVIVPVDDGSGDVTSNISMGVVIGSVAAVVVLALLLDR
jgi:hypothetical protein